MTKEVLTFKVGHKDFEDEDFFASLDIKQSDLKTLELGTDEYSGKLAQLLARQINHLKSIAPDVFESIIVAAADNKLMLWKALGNKIYPFFFYPDITLMGALRNLLLQEPEAKT